MSTIGPTIDCHDAQRWLDPALDGELDAARQLELDAHLASCAPCRERHDSAAALRSVLRQRLPYHRASAVLQQRIAAAVATPPVTARPAPMKALWPRLWPLAAGVVLGMLASGGFQHWQAARAAQSALVQAVAAAHLRALQPGHLADVASTDQHTVKPWFAGRLDYSPPVQDYAGQGYALIGGRLDYLAGRPVAALVYQRRQHTIDVFVWPEAQEAAPEAAERAGYHLLSWSDGRQRWWLASDLNATELAQFGALLREGRTGAQQVTP